MPSRLHPWWIWTVFALPALAMGIDLATSTNPRILHILVHPTGEWAARFLILSLMATPLMMLLPGWRGPRWLVRNRRYLGVAAFGYAAAHTLFYLLDKASLATVLEQATRFDIATGWLAFLIFLPLAATSFDGAVRALGRRWKPLQRWAWAAGGLTFLHWASLHDWGHPTGAIVWFAPLAALTLYRLWWNFLRDRPAAA